MHKLFARHPVRFPIHMVAGAPMTRVRTCVYLKYTLALSLYASNVPTLYRKFKNDNILYLYKVSSYEI